MLRTERRCRYHVKVSLSLYKPFVLAVALAAIAVASDSGSRADSGDLGDFVPVDLVPSDPCRGLPRNTLLVGCSPCASSAPCVVYDQDPSSPKLTGCDFNTTSELAYCPILETRSCDIQCFERSIKSNDFTFSVRFEDTSAELMKRRTISSGLTTPVTDKVPFQSNTFVKSIGKLAVPQDVTTVTIFGGKFGTVTEGLAADVTISADAFAPASQLRSISLLNLDLHVSITDALVSVPSGLGSLSLKNTKLDKLPTNGLRQLTELESLTLSDNALTSISPQDLDFPRLTSLDLSSNKLTSFAANTPKLVDLTLKSNNLDAIPQSVFTFTNLRQLNLADNPIRGPLVLSSSQVKFLQNLNLTIELLEAPVNSTISQSLSDKSPDVPVSTILFGGLKLPVIIDESIAGSTLTNATSQVESRTSTVSASASSSSGQRVRYEATQPEISTNALTPNPTPASPGDSTASANTMSTGKDDSDSSTLLIVFVVLGVVVIALAVGFVWRKKAKERRALAALHLGRSQPYTKMGDHTDDSGSVTSHSVHSGDTPLWVDSELLSYRLRALDIVDDRVIGSGGSAIVWLVSYRGRHKLASKRLIENGRLNSKSVTDLVAEIKLAASLSHPSIVQFFGVAWTSETDVQALFEYMPSGDLCAYLARTEIESTNWLPDKLRLALDVVEALVYTHSFDPPLVHRDLKSRNVLLSADIKAKLSDFGCARSVSDNDTMTVDGVGTGRWLAPEVLAGSSSYDTSSDMYSFGVLLAELDTHRLPYADVLNAEGTTVTELSLLQQVAQGELQPTLSDSCPIGIRQVAMSCLSFHSSHRPTAIQAAFLLRQILEPSPKMVLYRGDSSS